MAIASIAERPNPSKCDGTATTSARARWRSASGLGRRPVHLIHVHGIVYGEVAAPLAAEGFVKQCAVAEEGALDRLGDAQERAAQSGGDVTHGPLPPPVLMTRHVHRRHNRRGAD